MFNDVQVQTSGRHCTATHFLWSGMPLNNHHKAIGNNVYILWTTSPDFWLHLAEEQVD